MSNVCITILSFNGSDSLRSCIESFKRISTKHSFSIYILDNNSQDDSVRIIHQSIHDFPELDIHFSQSKTNTGFAGGHNHLIKTHIDAFDYFLPFNQDAMVRDAHFLDSLIDALVQNDNKAIVQSNIYTFENELSAAGCLVTYFGLGVPSTQFYKENSVVDVGTTQFAAAMIPAEVIKEVGYMQDFYFAYNEDLDYSQRVRLFNYKNLCDCRVGIAHDQKPGRFRQKKFGTYLAERNRLYYLLSYFSWPVLVTMLPILITHELATLFFFIQNGNTDSKIKGYKHIYEHFDEIMMIRKENRKILRESGNSHSFYHSHVARLDRTKLVNDPGISPFSKFASGLLNILYLAWYPVYIVTYTLFK